MEERALHILETEEEIQSTAPGSYAAALALQRRRQTSARDTLRVVFPEDFADDGEVYGPPRPAIFGNVADDQFDMFSEGRKPSKQKLVW